MLSVCMDWFTYLTVPINLCWTLSIDVIDDAVKAWHFAIPPFSSNRPHDPSPTHPLSSPTTLTRPPLHLCISSNSRSVQTTSRSCNSTTRPICWCAEQELLTPSVLWSEWDTLGRWVPETKLEFGLTVKYSSGIQRVPPARDRFKVIQHSDITWLLIPGWLLLIMLFLFLPALKTAVACSERQIFTAKAWQQNRRLFWWKCCRFLHYTLGQISHCLYSTLYSRSQNLLHTVLIMFVPGAPWIVSIVWTAEL